MAWVAGVFGNFSGLPLAPPDIEVLNGRALTPGYVLACPHHPLYRFAVMGCVFAIPSGDAASQDPLDDAAVELCEDPRVNTKSVPSSLMCVHHVKCLVMWKPRNLKLSTHSTRAQSMWMGTHSPLILLQSTISSLVLLTHNVGLEIGVECILVWMSTPL
jgi:hypothetical protein